MKSTEHDRGMLLLALAWARQDARAARKGSAEQHDAASRGGRIVYTLKTSHGMSEGEIDSALSAMPGAVS